MTSSFAFVFLSNICKRSTFSMQYRVLMKRVSSVENEQASKRVKTDHVHGDHFIASSEVDASDLLQDGQKGGHLLADVIMTWSPISGKHQALIETQSLNEPGKKYRFEVVFTGRCVPHFSRIPLETTDRVYLSLKEVEVEQLKVKTISPTLPLKLVYSQGVVMKIIKRGKGLSDGGILIDTWEVHDWFSTPLPLPVRQLPLGPSDAGVVEVAAGNSEPITTTTNDVVHKGHSLPSLKSHKESTELSVTSTTDSIESIQPVITKKQMRRLAKTRSVNKQNPDEPEEIEVGVGTVLDSGAQAQQLAPGPLPPSKVVATVAGQSNLDFVVNSVNKRPPLTGNFQGETFGYQAIKFLYKGQLANIIGVVVYASDVRTTRTGELSCMVKVVDPSMISTEHLDDVKAFSINCFQKSREDWLPNPMEGDVLILRQVRVVTYNGTSGTGFHDQFQWCIFSAKTGRFNGNLPKLALVGVSHQQYTPFISPEPTEIQYCVRLRDWWRQLQNDSKGVVQKAGRGTTGAQDPYRVPAISTQRQHRVIRDAGPDVPPQGYFDCTVELLYGHRNDNDVFSLYVTDYSKHPELPPVVASWCPAGLSEYILKIELWDKAAELAPQLRGHEYYTIRNVRMRVSNGRTLEGKCVEDKIVLADKDSAHVNGLLKRKKQWELDHADEIKSAQFKNILFENAVADVHSYYTVEILHILPANSSSQPCVYVTDYTLNLSYAWQGQQESWSSNLDGCIFRVNLRDQQAQYVDSLKPGSYCRLERVRIHKSEMEGYYTGQLGGNEQNVIELKVNDRNNEVLQALIVRKEAWRKQHTTPVQSLRSLDTEVSEAIEEEVEKNYEVIAEIDNCRGSPSKHCLRAHAVDFWPLRLVDCFWLLCRKCNKRIPDERAACFDCDDFEKEYVEYMFQFMVLLQDEDGRKLTATLIDQSDFVQGLALRSPLRDAKTLEAFEQRTKPVLGNLIEVHDALAKQMEVDIDTPYFNFIVGGWETTKDTRAYCLLDVESPG